MQIYLPIAEMAVPVEQIFLVSSVVGFLSGMLGIGGGFLTTPFLIFVGIPPSIAVGTQTTQLVASSVAGVFGHLKRQNVDMKMGFVMLIGGFWGSLGGAFIFKFLERIGQIDLTISMLYIVLLGSIGLMMLFDIMKGWLFPKSSIRSEFNNFKVGSFVSALPFKMRFPRSKLYISGLLPLGIGFVGGVLASILGIGGGFLLVPAMIYILGMPMALVAGTSLFQMIFTTGFAAILHAVLNHSVDIVLGAILILGGVLGAQVGVGFTQFVKGTPARMFLTVIVLAVCAKLLFDVFIEPSELFSTINLSDLL